MLRVIGGHWRGRRWRFTADAGIRPTPDRVRETLFNWLSPSIAGASCLDLFAGSGALGLEALSRGAAHVTFVDNHFASASALDALLLDWIGKRRADAAEVITADAMRFLDRTPVPFDCVFLDPPFASSLANPAIAALQRGWLAPNALIYLENAARAELPLLPQGWSILRSKRAGEVGYHLLTSAGGEQGPGQK